MRLRKKRYHEGGGIPSHEHLADGSHPILESLIPDPLVSESTQPSGYTQPIGLFSEPINIIPRPAEITQASDDAFEPISWLELFSDPMRAFRFYNQNPQFNAAANLPGYEGRFEPFRRPTKAEFINTGGSAMDFAGQVFNPATYAQTAVELDQDLTELDRQIIAAFEDGRFSPADLDRVAGQLSDVGLKTLFLIGGASMLRGSGIGSLKVPASDISKGRAVFGRNLGEAADDFIGSGVQQQTGPLQQLTGSNVPVATSNVPVAASEAIKVAETTPVLQNLAKDYQTERAVRTKKGGYVSEEAPYLESNIAKGGSSVDTGDFDAVPLGEVENLGVYQYPGLMKGSNLEKSVKAKDGSILKSVVEDYANNLPKSSTREKNAILNALVELQQEFPGKTIDYEALRSYVSLNIEPATVIQTKDQANYGLANIKYYTEGAALTSPDAVSKTLVYQDESLGIARPHLGMKDSASYWIRSFIDPDYPEIYYVTEWQTDLQKLKTPDDLIKAPIEGLGGDDFITKDTTILPSSQLAVQYQGIADELNNLITSGDLNIPDPQVRVRVGNVIDRWMQITGGEIKYGGINQIPGLKEIENITTSLPYVVTADKPLISQLSIINNQINNLDEIIVRYEGYFNLPDSQLGEGLTKQDIRNKIIELQEQLLNYELAFEEGIYALEEGRDEFIKNLPNRDALIKEEVNLRKSQYESLKLKWVNESMLDAARNGQTTMRVPTPETSRRIQGHGSGDFEGVHRKYKDFPKYYKKEFGVEVRQVTDSKGNSWWEVDIPEKYFNQNMMYMEGEVKTPSEFKTYKKGGILQAMAKKNRPDKNKFVSKKVRILRREGKGLRQAVAIALDMYEKKKQEKKFQEGGLFQRLKDRREKIKAAKEYYKEEAENPTMYLNEEGKIMMPGVSYDTGEPVYYEEELTPRQYKRFNRAQLRNYKRDLRRADREARQQERQERRDERIKERGYRRVGRADILPFDTEDILDYLAGESNAGYYLGPKMLGRLTSRRFRDKVGNISMNPVSDNTGLISSVEKGADDSVLDHELIHKSQYGPLQLLASYIGLPGAGRIQDKTTRKAFKNLMKSIRKNDTVLDENLGGPAQGNYMAGDKSRDIEFDAILKSGLSSASVAGYDLEGKSFDEIVSILAQAEKDGNISTNMGHLSRFMTGTNWSDEQKGFIMDAIKANLGREAFTAEDARQDLR